MTCLPNSESEDSPRGDIDRASDENQDAYSAAAFVNATVDSAFDAGRHNIGVVPVEKVRDTDFVSWASFDNFAQPQRMVGLSLICLGELNLRTLKFFALFPS
jgi:hypothetical protein